LRDLTGTLELSGNDKQFRVGGARDRFDAYAPGKPAAVAQPPGASQQLSTATSTKRLGRPDVQHREREDAAPSQAPISSTRDRTPRRWKNLFLEEDL
jgi:hypothetical protein